MKAPTFKAIKIRIPGAAKKTRARPRQIETPIHMAILEYLQWVMPQGTMIHHSPNEVAVSGEEIAIAIAKQRAMGTRPGWPDLEVIHPKPGGFGFFVVEVKSDTGALTSEQKLRRIEFQKLGVPFCLARSTRDVEEFLAWENIETRVKK